LENFNLVVSNKFSIEFEAKSWKYLFVASSNEAKHYSYLLLHHMMVSKGESILGWYHYEPPQGMVKEQQTAKSFS